MNERDYVQNSIALHLFFDRIMKEHSFFLEASFMEPNQNLKDIARNFQTNFSRILNKTITLANKMVSKELLDAKEIVTDKTLQAETMTTKLSGIPIDTDITNKELRLEPEAIKVNSLQLQEIERLNQNTLPIIQNLIRFKSEILEKVLMCQLYTTNYPLLITHILNEAKMYFELLSKLERREPFSKEYLYEQELFWNNIMKEHAEFIRGLLDPSETKLMMTADEFAEKYEMILKKYAKNPYDLQRISLKETINFRDFKIAGEEGILNCNIKSIIIPLLSDHVVREANHFIRLLKNLS